MPIQPAAVELLAAASPVLTRRGRWYVFGAQAVIAYGVPRLSADVDVTIQLEPDEPQAFVHDMDGAGFELRVRDPDFVRRTRVLPFVHRATGMPLDVVLAGSGLESEFIERSHPVDLGGPVVPMLHVEDLIVAKVLAGRPKDLDDVRVLWGIHGATLDTSRVRGVLRQLEDALGQSDLVPAFDVIAATPSPDGE